MELHVVFNEYNYLDQNVEIFNNQIPILIILKLFFIKLFFKRATF